MTYPIDTSASPVFTEAPWVVFTATILPSDGAMISFSIFIASRIHTTSPALTVSPTFTLIETTVPGIGALIVVAPAGAGVAAGAAAGAVAGAAAAFGAT